MKTYALPAFRQRAPISPASCLFCDGGALDIPGKQATAQEQTFVVLLALVEHTCLPHRVILHASMEAVLAMGPKAASYSPG